MRRWPPWSTEAGPVVLARRGTSVGVPKPGPPYRSLPAGFRPPLDHKLGFLNISFEMILYFERQISIQPHFISRNILIKIRNLKLPAKTQMSSHSHPTAAQTHRTSAGRVDRPSA